MISDKEFLEFLNDDTFDGSLETKLKSLLDEELEKSEEEMDPELIECCLDELKRLESEKQHNDKNKEKGDCHKKIRVRRIGKFLLAAAIIAALAIGAFSVTAQIPDIKLFGGAVEFNNNSFRINFNSDEDEADSPKLIGSKLEKELKNNGFSSVMLPEELLSDGYEVSKIDYKAEEDVITATVRIPQGKRAICVHISQFTDKSLMGGSEYPSATGEIYKLYVSGIDAYVFEQAKCCSIVYQEGMREYLITTPFDIEKTKKLAETIKGTP